VLAVGIRQPLAVISALEVPYVDRQYCVHLCGGQLKPPASTDTSTGGLLSQPPAHLSEYLRSERGLTQLLTHSLTTLAAAASSREPNRSRSRNRRCPPPPPLVSFARAPPPQPPLANYRPTLQPPVHRPTSSRFTAVVWRAAPWRRTLANSCLSPY
jgi:hypothetical protein